MPDHPEVSHNVAVAGAALANESGFVMRAAMRAGHAAVPDIEAYIRAHNAPVLAAMAAVNAAVLRDIAAAVRAAVRDERIRCRMAVARARFEGDWTCTDDALSAIDAA
jgi:hypothetical protein